MIDIGLLLCWFWWWVLGLSTLVQPPSHILQTHSCLKTFNKSNLVIFWYAAAVCGGFNLALLGLSFRHRRQSHGFSPLCLVFWIGFIICLFNTMALSHFLTPLRIAGLGCCLVRPLLTSWAFGGAFQFGVANLTTLLWSLILYDLMTRELSPWEIQHGGRMSNGEAEQEKQMGFPMWSWCCWWLLGAGGVFVETTTYLQLMLVSAALFTALFSCFQFVVNGLIVRISL